MKSTWVLAGVQGKVPRSVYNLSSWQEEIQGLLGVDGTLYFGFRGTGCCKTIFHIELLELDQRVDQLQGSDHLDLWSCTYKLW